MSISKCSPITPLQHAVMVWALPISLATTQGIIIIFFSSGYLDVSVLRVGSLSSDISSIYQVVPFGNPRIYRLCAALLGLSQLTTSFIASQTLGIHHAPLIALKNLSVWPLHEAHTTIILFDFAFPICQRTITNITIDTC